MRLLSAWRALARVELRALRAHAARTWLVIALVALPTAALVGASVLLETTRRTPDEERARVFGRADVRVDGVTPEFASELSASLPSSAWVARLDFARVEVGVPGLAVAARGLDLEAGALDDAVAAPAGLAVGLLRVVAGRAPERSDEVALSRALGELVARGVGDEIVLRERVRRVTGLVIDPEDLDQPVVASVGALEAASETWLVADRPSELVDFAQRARDAGLHVRTRDELGAPDAFESLAILVIGGFGFFEAALVIGAAFAVGLRRRQRELGLLATTGATRGDLRAAVLASAFTCAAVGVALGLALGVAAAFGAAPFLDAWNRRANGALEFPFAELVAAVALGLGAAAAAAAIPAWSASNLPIRAALGGRRPSTESSRGWLVLAVVLVVLGCASVVAGARADGVGAALGILGGSVLGVLGLGASTPWLLGALARAAGALPLPWRLAVRDAGRFRARNGPVVTAVLAGLSIAVLLASLVGSLDELLANASAPLRDDQIVCRGPAAAATARGIADELGALACAPLQAARVDGVLVEARAPGSDASRWLAVGDEALLCALGVEPTLGATAFALCAADDAAPRELELFAGERSLGRVTPMHVAVDQQVRGPRYVLTHAALAALRGKVAPPPGSDGVPWLVRTRAPLAPDTLARAQELAALSGGATVDAAALHVAPSYDWVRLALACCFVVGLTVVFIATALSAAESAEHVRVLVSVGAPPAVLRAHAAWRALHLAWIGCVLAVPAGLLPSYGLVALAELPLEFTLPWRELALVVFAFPALAFAGAWLCSRPGGTPCFESR